MQILNRVSPVEASTNDNTLVSSSVLYTGNAWAISYTIINTGDDSIDYEVVAGNTSVLSDATVVQASATLASDAIGSYSVSTPVWTYYGIRIVSTVADTPGEASIVGISKG